MMVQLEWKKRVNKFELWPNYEPRTNNYRPAEMVRVAVIDIKVISVIRDNGIGTIGPGVDKVKRIWRPNKYQMRFY